MAYLLFPGRHHVLTEFQRSYLREVLAAPAGSLRDIAGRPLEAAIHTLVWAVTSANHGGTRRNPLPAHRREAAIEDFSRDLAGESFVFLIDDLGTTPRFAEYVLRKIEVESRGRLLLTPENTVLGCSTPAVIAQYEALGFRVLPVELVDRAAETYQAARPWELLMQLVEADAAGADWRTAEAFTTRLAPASRRMLLKYDYGGLVVELYRRPLLTEDGDLTATRDYNTYVRAFDDGAARKFALVRDHLLPGRIVDIGCCTGSLLAEMTRDDRLRESDFFGIEVARPLYAECVHRKEQGAFASDHVFFHHRDFAAEPVFRPSSVNTFTTFSLTHEVESYGGRAALERFLELLFEQTAIGGRWINVDVVGPEAAEDTVLLWLNEEDGRAERGAPPNPPAEREACRHYLAELSTRARFDRFTRDFRRGQGERIPFEEVTRGGRQLLRLTLRAACEFLSKKDYTDNWLSEMHETFCFWSFEEWRSAVQRHGFRVHAASHAFANPWILEHRYQPAAALYYDEPGELRPRPWPSTNMLLVADKV